MSYVTIISKDGKKSIQDDDGKTFEQDVDGVKSSFEVFVFGGYISPALSKHLNHLKDE